MFINIARFHAFSQLLKRIGDALSYQYQETPNR